MVIKKRRSGPRCPQGQEHSSDLEGWRAVLWALGAGIRILAAEGAAVNSCLCRWGVIRNSAWLERNSPGLTPNFCLESPAIQGNSHEQKIWPILTRSAGSMRAGPADQASRGAVREGLGLREVGIQGEADRSEEADPTPQKTRSCSPPHPACDLPGGQACSSHGGEASRLDPLTHCL